MILPAEAQPLVQALAPAFTRPTLRRFVLLMVAALLTTGRRTVANLLRIAAPLAPGHRTTYQRVLSSAAWSAMRLACGLCRARPRHCCPPIGRSSWSATTPSTATPAGASTARPGTATRSAPATATPPGGTATSGSSSPSWSASRSPPGPGPCPSWWTCTAPRRTTGRGSGRTAPRPSSCAAAPRHADVVPRPAVRLRRRRRLRHARGRPVLPPPPRSA